MPDQNMISQALLQQCWKTISDLETPIRETHDSALFNLHGCELILGLQPLPPLSLPGIQSTEIFSKKPAFKALTIPVIDALRRSLFTGKDIIERSEWAEYLLRYMEINLSSIFKKARLQFGSTQSARLAILDLTAFLLDVYFEKKDLRFLNLTLKLIDLPGLLSIKNISNDLLKQDKGFLAALYQVRLLIMTEAAIQQLQSEPAE
jgi:hypothetical protein